MLNQKCWLFCLLLFLYFCVENETADCYFEGGYCDNIGYLDCAVSDNSTGLVEVYIGNCSLSLIVDGMVLIVYKNQTIEFDLPSNIESLFVGGINNVFVNLTASIQNTGLTRLDCGYRVAIESDFFNYYPQLKQVFLKHIIPNQTLFSTELQYLTKLVAYFQGPTFHTLDNTNLHALPNLLYLDL